MNELHNLWYFVQVAKTGGIRLTANRLGISPASLSKNITRLESKLRVQLFARSARGVRLTEAGECLCQRLTNAFGEIENSVNELEGVTHEPRGVVRLSTVTAYGQHCVLPLLPEFLNRYPHIDLIMSFHDGGRVVTRQNFDVRITYGWEPDQDKVAQTLCYMPLLLVGSPAYLAIRGTPLTPEDLVHHDCLAVAPQGVRPWKFVKKGTGRRARDQATTIMPKGRVLVTGEMVSVVDAAKFGLGLTVASAENALVQLQDGSLVSVLPDYAVVEDEIHTAVIIQYPRNRSLAPKIRVLTDFLIDKLKGINPLEARSDPMNTAIKAR